MSTREELIAELAEKNPDALLADGFEEALLWLTNSEPYRAVYSTPKCIQILMDRDGMSHEDAIEFFEFNVIGSYLGKGTPVFLEIPDLPAP